MPYNDTTPAQKYGPTPVYGACEAVKCEAKARTTCVSCGGEFCLGHAAHVEHQSVG